MVSPIRRREVLQAGGVIAAGSLAGCSYFDNASASTNPRDTTISVLNADEEMQHISLRVFDPDADKRPEAIIFYENFELDGKGDTGENEQVFEKAFSTGRTIVEVQTPDFVRQFTYYPDSCDGEQTPLLQIIITSDLRYQVACRGGA